MVNHSNFDIIKFSVSRQIGSSDEWFFLQSYAGKYVPAIGERIHAENPKAKMKINLKGVMIGDGLCDPLSVRFKSSPRQQGG